jgi:SAM-dependent methyltransferase
VKESFAEPYFKPYGKDPKRSFSYREQIKWLSNFLNLDQAVVLDYGCGLGEMLKLFGDVGSITFGCDVSDYAVEKCNEQGLNVRVLSDSKIPFAEKFDLIVMRGVFQHLWSPNDVIRDIHSHLKPGGFVAILSTPNAESLCYLLFSQVPAMTKEINKNLPSKSSISHCLELNDFHIIRYRYPYLKSGYANPIKDYFRFLLRLLKITKSVPTFPGNMIDLVGQKC